MQDNIIRGRLNAWLLSLLDDYMHRKYGMLKTRLFKDISSTAVELGPGTGANLRYLPRGIRLIAIEPNIRMHGRLVKKAEQYGIHLDLRTLSGERLDIADASVDFVYASLVLCSVTEPDKVLSEVLRILRPGGRFVCIEHVEAPLRSFDWRLQHILAAPWRWMFEGCCLCRKTASILEAVGFSSVTIEFFRLSTLFVPIRHQIAAICIK